jgi:hypothetical protein
MDKAAIDIGKALERLTIFELRGEWRRLHHMPRRCGSPATS